MFSYNISKTADPFKFKEICSKIEEGINGIKKEKLITDVDGSQIQIYSTENGRIKVINDYEIGAVYADSNINLSKII